jgi:hypothetical protein
MKLCISTLLAVLCVACPLHSAAQTTESVVIFTVDSTYNYNSPGTGLIGSIIDSAGNKRTAEFASTLRTALGFDLAPQALPVITCGVVPTTASPCPSVYLADASPAAIRTVLEQKNVTQGVVVSYFAMFNPAEFWARLVVQSVRISGEGISNVGVPKTAYYISRLSDADINLQGQPWKEGIPPRLETEVRASWPELRAGWLQLESDGAGDSNPQEKWKSAPKVQAQDGWVFNCRGMFGCSGQHILRQTDERAWITPGRGSMIASINKSQAAFATNFMALMIR